MTRVKMVCVFTPINSHHIWIRICMKIMPWSGKSLKGKREGYTFKSLIWRGELEVFIGIEYDLGQQVCLLIGVFYTDVLQTFLFEGRTFDKKFFFCYKSFFTSIYFINAISNIVTTAGATYLIFSMNTWVSGTKFSPKITIRVPLRGDIAGSTDMMYGPDPTKNVK